MRALMMAWVALILTGCAASSVTDYSPETDFARYDRWAFAPEASDEFQTLDDRRIQAAVREALRSKPLTEAPVDQADLWVSWRIVQEQRLEQTGLGLGVGFGHGHFGWSLAAPPPVREVTEGKLVLRLVDRETRDVIWQATGQRYLRENQSPQTRRTIINELVSDMFSQYPPADH